MNHTKAHLDNTDCRSNTAQSCRRQCLLLSLATAILGLSQFLLQAHEPASHPRQLAHGAPSQAKPTLPALPAGVTELKFSEIFVQPVGPRGLELTEKLRGLEGQRVRILGYMAQREGQPPGAFLLTPFPVQVHDHDNGLAEDFPASVVQVSVPTLHDKPVPYAPGLMLLTGTMSLGNRAEADGRVSMVRLDLDPPAKKRSRSTKPNAGKGAEDLMRRTTSRP